MSIQWATGYRSNFCWMFFGLFFGGEGSMKLQTYNLLWESACAACGLVHFTWMDLPNTFIWEVFIHLHILDKLAVPWPAGCELTNILYPSQGYASIGWQSITYLHQLCIKCSLEDLPGKIYDREGWGERIKETCAVNSTWWWMMIYIYIYKMGKVD